MMVLLRAVPRTLSQHGRSFSTRPSLALWNGTTQPVKNLQIPLTISPTLQKQQEDALRREPSLNPPATAADEINAYRRKFIEDIVSRATNTDSQSYAPSKATSQRARRNSLNNAPAFRTDGPLTPYPMRLDTGEQLEPKQATLVRVVDKSGEKHTIVVAEVDDDMGEQRSILLALDRKSGSEGEAAVRRISAEETYAMLGMDGKA